MEFITRGPKQGINPEFFVIYGEPKVGKSTICSLIENSLIIDLNHEYDHLGGTIVECKDINELKEVAKTLEDKKQRFVSIILDNASWLQEIVKPFALQLYHQSPLGKGSKTSDIMEVAFGGGYYWIRVAFMKIITSFKNYCDTLILVGHSKEKTRNFARNQEPEITEELDLSGQLKTYILKEADTVGKLYRDSNLSILDFNGTTIVAQSRLPHLRGKQIVVAESDDDGNIVGHWDKIFIKTNKKQ